MIRALVLILSLVTGSAAAETETGRHGLMWNRTGLPAVFPLIVKTDPGSDYYLVLRDVTTGAPGLAAYVEGGRFFQVLVPPGTFDLHIAEGRGWLDETRLFGPDTLEFLFEPPLTFRVRGLRTKVGHIVDLRGGAASGVGRKAGCDGCGPVTAGLSG